MPLVPKHARRQLLSKSTSITILISFLFFFLSFLHVEAVVDSNVDFTIHQVVIFAIDGLSGSATLGVYMPSMVGKIINKYGAFTTQARTYRQGFMGWISIFFGTSDITFGCDWDGECDNTVPSTVGEPDSIVDFAEDVFDFDITILSQQSREISQVVGDRPIKRFSHITNDIFDYIDDELTSTHLSSHRKRVVIVHIKMLEHEAVSTGYLSRNYLALLGCLDRRLFHATKDLWQVAPNNTLFLLTSNHGGKHWGVNENDLAAIQVPVAFWGQGVKQRTNLFSNTIETPQVAPTLFNLLALYSTSRTLPSNQDLSSFDSDRPEQWTHHAISAVYERDYHKSVTFQTVFGHDSDDDNDNEVCEAPRSVNHRYIHNSNLLIQVVFLFTFIMISFELQRIQNSRSAKLPK